MANGVVSIKCVFRRSEVAYYTFIVPSAPFDKMDAAERKAALDGWIMLLTEERDKGE